CGVQLGEVLTCQDKFCCGCVLLYSLKLACLWDCLYCFVADAPSQRDLRCCRVMPCSDWLELAPRQTGLLQRRVGLHKNAACLAPLNQFPLDAAAREV